MNDNKLIAEFIGVKYPMLKGSDLQYHTSWDWLMPVLSKILDLSFQDDGDAEDFYSIRDCMPDINHTYKAVVEFIEEHNVQLEKDIKNGLYGE